MTTRAERLAGGLIGLLVGDALGVPYEFHDAEDLPPAAEIEFEPPASLAWRAHRGTPPGTWSDDGAQALCLLDSLLARGRFDADDFGARLLRWYRGQYWVNGRLFDVGMTTGHAIAALQAGTPALEAGPTHEDALGNGSLMRVLPLALWHRGSDVELVADAQAQSRVTHGHLRAQVCCALYCLWARRILEEAADPWSVALASLRELYARDETAATELDQFVRPDDPPEKPGGGYVVDCLRSSRRVQAAGDYEVVVKAAVALGRDTDTTACVAGGIAGLRDGVEAIPARWRQGLRGMEIVTPLLEGLLARG
jgi:ADP-ribosylglycohydrolase